MHSVVFISINIMQVPVLQRSRYSKPEMNTRCRNSQRYKQTFMCATQIIVTYCDLFFLRFFLGSAKISNNSETRMGFQFLPSDINIFWHNFFPLLCVGRTTGYLFPRILSLPSLLKFSETQSI